MPIPKKTVFVGLSGGVDSSVAALRLLKEGYFVVGVFIKVWHPQFLECNWERERLDAMTVAAKLDIPFLTCDAEEAYKNGVADYFITEYTAGRTPNPDVMCNKHVKFGAFYTFAKERGADFIATGHYAQVVRNEERSELHRGIDSAKDQSYFLWTLTEEVLAHTLLPVGASPKTIIRAEAKKHGLLTADKRDSQGICFLGHIDIPEFLAHFIDLIEGPVLNEKGEVIGIHKGALVYTVGQRHGFTVLKKESTTASQYVVARDIKKNTITVSTQKPSTAATAQLHLTDLNYIHYTPKVGDRVLIETRYHQKPSPCEVTAVNAHEIVLTYRHEAEAVSIGQSCVLYDDTRCLGGGIITS